MIILSTRELKYYWSNVSRGPTCHVWTGPTLRGYGRTPVDGKNEYAHRLAWFIHTGDWPEGLILHKCDNPLCVTFEHLYEGTSSHNMEDAMRRGKPHLTRKLTAPKVLKIRELIRLKTLSYTAIGELFGVQATTIRRIETGKRWASVKTHDDLRIRAIGAMWVGLQV